MSKAKKEHLIRDMTLTQDFFPSKLELNKIGLLRCLKMSRSNAINDQPCAGPLVPVASRSSG